MGTDKEFELRLKKDNAIRKRYYIMAKLRKSDIRKLRKWLEGKDQIEIGDDTSGHVYLLNQDKINNCRTPNLFH